VPAIVEPWSEPPFATIGLGSGTMAGYARPYQHMTYYEIDDVIRNFSMPEDCQEGRFTFFAASDPPRRQPRSHHGRRASVVGESRAKRITFTNTYTYLTEFKKDYFDKKGLRDYDKAPYVNLNTNPERAANYPANSQ